MARSLADRFESRVDRSGEHHLWLGATKANGAGMLRVGKGMETAQRVAWELVHGQLPDGARVFTCPDNPACVRIEHLRLAGTPEMAAPESQGRARRGQGTARELRPGVWELAVSAGQFSDGTPRRLWRTVRAKNRTEATRALALFATEAGDVSVKPDRDLKDLTLDDAVEQFCTEHLLKEKGRAARTVEGYRGIHRAWFSPHIGARRLVDIDQAMLDRLFGAMRHAGCSHSRMHQARCLYGPLFKWAKRRRIITVDPMADFALPTSSYISKERVPPEVEELSFLLAEALAVVPEIAPLLTLAAVTGMRRGELVALRRSRIQWNEGRITVDIAADKGRQVKATKTRRERPVHVDDATIAMLRRHCGLMDERAEACGLTVGPDAFVFSDAMDCALPWPADAVTKRVAALKDHLGIADKRSEVVAMEDEALRLFRSERASRVPGRPGADPKGAMSYDEIGRRLGRSQRWVMLAVRAAERREAAQERGLKLDFDGSILGLRKFTSSELLDAGFNLSMVAQRQGHGPEVLARHYSKSRRSADRKAAEHLGRLVHGDT